MLDQIISDPYYVLAIILLATWVGWEGDRRKWFGKVSGVLVTIGMTAILTSMGLLPRAGDPQQPQEVYQVVYNYVVPFSIPLLLWHANLKRIFKEAGRLSLLFLIGSAGIALGAILAFHLLSLGAEGAKIAGVYVATYTGGSVNFIAAAKSLDFVESSMFPVVITIDNLFTTLFFALLFAFPAIDWIAKRYRRYSEVTEATGLEESREAGSEGMKKQSVGDSLAIGLCLSALIVLCSRWIDQILTYYFDLGISLEILLATVLAVTLVNVFDAFFEKIADASFEIGMFLLFVFLAVIGAACDFFELFQSSGVLILFVVITLGVHLVVTLIAAKLLNYSLEEALVTSAANAGGPSVSAAMASNFDMKTGMTPAVLVGILGYVVGTFLGVGVGLLLQ